MHIIRRLAMVVLPVALFLPGIANANVVRPAVDIALFAGDSGAVFTALSQTEFEFDINATAFAIVYDAPTPSTDIPNQDFLLHGTYDGGANAFYGTFSIGGGLLEGTFDNLSILKLGSGSYDFKADLTYTSGSLTGGMSLTSGRLEGIGSTSNLGAKIGPIAAVPVPAAAWLFGSGLIGLVGIARRKKS